MRSAGLFHAVSDCSGHLFDALVLLGRGNLSVGRLFEAHVNAVQLIHEFAAPDQVGIAMEAVAAGALFGLWVTDGTEPVRWSDGQLSGIKSPCSGAGHVTHAVITALTESGVRLAMVTLGRGERVQALRGLLPGMRAAVNGTVSFKATALPDAALFGPPGAYLREPSLSTGAWRTSAVTLGGLDSLVDAARTALVTRRHTEFLLQQDRFGRIAIAQETARLWTKQASHIAGHEATAVPQRVAYVNLARIAVETACLDAMRHIHRSLGLGAFIRPSLVERVSRDLAVYLRQPAPDAVLTEAGLHALVHP